MAQHERQAGGDLVGGGGAVAGRAPVDGVGDQDTRAVEADRRQHAVEQLAGAPDKGAADAVLVGAGRLADDHDRGRGIAVGDDRVGRGALQPAAFEPGDRRFQRRDGVGARRCETRRLRRLPRRLGKGRRRGRRDRAHRGGWGRRRRRRQRLRGRSEGRASRSCGSSRSPRRRRSRHTSAAAPAPPRHRPVSSDRRRMTSNADYHRGRRPARASPSGAALPWRNILCRSARMTQNSLSKMSRDPTFGRVDKLNCYILLASAGT